MISSSSSSALVHINGDLSYGLKEIIEEFYGEIEIHQKRAYEDADLGIYHRNKKGEGTLSFADFL